MKSLLTRSLILLAIALAACSPQDAPATSSPTSAPPTTESTPDSPPTAESTPEMTADASAADTAPPAESTPEMTAEANAADTAPPAESTPDAADSAASGDPIVVINQPNTGLRAGPGVSYERVATVTSGDRLTVTGRSGEAANLWYQVTLPDGTTAWAWSRVADLQPADADVPEVEPPPAS